MSIGRQENTVSRGGGGGRAPCNDGLAGTAGPGAAGRVPGIFLKKIPEMLRYYEVKGSRVMSLNDLIDANNALTRCLQVKPSRVADHGV